MTSAILSVDKLHKTYQGKPLLQDIGFSLGEGEILCLLGPSGSGKTTLLRLLAGLERPDGGTIRFAGRDLAETPPHRRNFGMMFQEYALFPHKDVWENVAFGLRMQRLPAAQTAGRVEEMLHLVGLEGFGHRRVDELSGGERQRVALARSLAPRPPLLLLDEPLGSLDRLLRDRLTGEIRLILKSLGVAAVFVTHDQGEAYSIADRIAILQENRLQQLAAPEELYLRPANRLVASFLGLTNLVSCSLGEDGLLHSPFGRLPTNLAGVEPADAGTLLLPPEGARLAGDIEGLQPGLVIAGRVASRVFQGATYRVAVDSCGHRLAFNLPLAPRPPEAGLAITLAIDGGSLLLLP